MMFLEGIVMLLVSLWLIRRIGRARHITRPSVPDPDLACRLKIAELKYQTATKNAEIALLKTKPRQLQVAEGRELDQLVTADAIHREERAKAALVAVLRRQGCNQEQIDSVLNMVDNEPE